MRLRNVFSVGLVLIQIGLAVRVFGRFVRTRAGEQIVRMNPADSTPVITILIPVLNEEKRLAPCLESLTRQSPVVQEILVVDGGSEDGTIALAEQFAADDPRITILSAGPAPSGENGKVFNLDYAYRSLPEDREWVLIIDADVRCTPYLAESLLAKAETNHIDILSVAVQQQALDRTNAIVNPALLTTLIYRFGIPGSKATSRSTVQANGQCMLIRRDVLDQLGGFFPYRNVIAEDVAMARDAWDRQYRVGFYEAPGLIEVEMYQTASESWRNWPRSLPLPERQTAAATALQLGEVTLVQALPFWVAILDGRLFSVGSVARTLNRVLLLSRLGVLAGSRRAYGQMPMTYWLSPLVDLPAALRLWQSWLQRSHEWRGRTVKRI